MNRKKKHATPSPKLREKKAFVLTLNYRQSLSLTMLTVIGIASFIFWDFITFSKLYLFTDIGSDTVNMFYPDLVHAARYIREEGLPGWSWHHGMGQNFFPGGLNSPFKLILYALGPDNLVWGIGWVEWLKFVLIGYFFHSYLRNLNVQPWVMAIGTLLLTFSGFMVLGSGWYGHSEKLLNLALLLWSFERFLNKKDWRLIPLAVLLVAGTRLYFFGVFSGVYLIVRFLELEYDWKRVLKTTGVMIACSLLGVLISSAWFASIVMNVMESPRVSGKASLSEDLSQKALFAFDSSQHYTTALFRTFSNDMLGSGIKFKGWQNYLEAPAFYCGMLSLLLFPLSFFTKGRKKWIYIGFAALWLLPVIFPWFRYAYSLFSGDYYKTGLSFIIPFTFTYLAIRALDNLNDFGKKGIMVVGVLLVIWMSLLNTDFDGVKTLASVNGLANFSLFLTGILLVTALWTKKHWLVMVAIFLVVGNEVARMGHITPNNRDHVSARDLSKKTGYNDWTVDALKAVGTDSTKFYRVNKFYSSGPAIHGSVNDARIQDYYSSPSYSSFNQGNYVNFLDGLDVIDASIETNTRWAPGVSRSEFLPLLIGTKYLLLKQKGSQLIEFLCKDPVQFGDVQLYEAEHFVPFGSCLRGVEKASVADSLPTIGKQMSTFFAAIIEDSDWGRVATLQHVNLDSMQMPNLQQFKDSVKVLGTRKVLDISTFSANEIAGSITTDRPEIMFFPMPFDPRWTAQVNGVETPMIKIDYGLAGLVLPKGEHQIRLTFSPPMLVVGSALSLIGLLAYLLLMVKKASLKNLSDNRSSST